MAAAPPLARDGFFADLGAAFEAAASAHTVKHRRGGDKIFGHWTKFCLDLGHEPSLSDVPGREARLCYILAFAHRFRRQGQTGVPVRAGTVEAALTAVGQGISNLGEYDPRKEALGSQRNHPLFSAYLSALKDQDEPSKRVHPVNTVILEQLASVLDFQHPKHGEFNRHVADLCVAGFFWLLRPAEYTRGAPDTRSQAFRLCDIHLTFGNHCRHAPTAPLNDANIIRAVTLVHLEFADQKNAVKGERIGHRCTTSDFLCPGKAICRIARRLRLSGAKPDCPLYEFYDRATRQIRRVTPEHIKNALQHAAAAVEDVTGIPPEAISARSLRPGGATALLCANVDPDSIQLLGRWKSDAMLRYLRVQATLTSNNFAQSMLTHGNYTFAPGINQHVQPLPREVPPSVAAILAHEELYLDEEA